MLDVVGKRGIAMVQDCAMLESGGRAVDLDGLVHGAILEAATAPAEQSQLRIRPEAAVFDPPAKELILARDPDAGEFRSAFTPIQSSSSAWASCIMKG